MEANMWLGTLLCSLAFLSAVSTLTPLTYLTASDKTRLKAVLESARPYQDVASVHYSVAGLKILGETIANHQEACNFIRTKVDPSSVESLYHAAATSKAIPNCPLQLPAAAAPTIAKAIAEEAAVVDIFYGVSAVNYLGQKYDSAKVMKNLLAALKKDDSVLNLGYAFHIATLLAGDVNPIYERIEDAIVQADEVDNKLAQFEGGLSITAIIVGGSYRLAEKVNKAPSLDKEKCVKFANYFMSRKHVQVVRATYHLLDVLSILTKNKYHIPVAITLASKSAVSTQEPTVQIRVTNLFGAAVGPLAVTVDSATRTEDGKAIYSKKPLLGVKGDTSLYELNFVQAKPTRGFYKLSVSAVPSKADERLVGNAGASLEIKVMTEVGVDSLEIGTVDIDQATSSKMTKVTHPGKLGPLLEADYHQKIQMKFSLRDKNAGLMLLHQVFVRLIYQKTKQEIVFVAEPDAAQIYHFDMDVSSKAKEFGYLSGRYQLDVIVGDAVISNPFSWHVADLDLSFPENPAPAKPLENQYAPRPEIKHVFREPEKRPSTVVSNSFTALTLAPLLLLFILWLKIGLNFSNFNFDFGTVGFHLGLASVLGLFVMFWLQLNMFSTLKYLAALGSVTFLCGNSMLSKIAASRK